MPLPLTRSQIEKLGVRLVARPQVDAVDLAQLHGLLSAYGQVLRDTTERVRAELDVSPTARVKNTGTILEKLERYGGSWLKSIQDIGGMRLVGDFDRAGQDTLVTRVATLFENEPRRPKIVDRRADPVQGYRAVHLVVFPRGIPIEIQVRTRRQHQWAELFEKLADHIGRGIRYGEPPAHWMSTAEQRTLDDGLRELYEASYTVRVLSVELAVAIAELIAAVEEAEREVPDAPELVSYQQNADEAIARLRQAIDELRAEADPWGQPRRHGT